MNTRTGFRGLAAELPARDEYWTTELTDEHFRAVEQFPRRFVEPDFLDAPKVASQVLLISAAGAMGKSTLARALASRLKSPLVDLAGLRVGDDTLRGRMSRVLGWTQGAAFIEELQDGKSCLILDSLDEAQLLAGREHFTAFLTDVARLVTNGVKRHQLILLGRPESVETTRAALEALGLTVSVTQLAPMTHDQAAELIDVTLDARSEKRSVSNSGGGAHQPVHRTHPAPFARFRDAILLDIAHALGQQEAILEEVWPKTEEFLGYPPVVLALAERLETENPELDYQNHKSGTIPEALDRGTLLLAIVHTILDREADKVRSRMQEALSLPSNDPRLLTLYTREEQAIRTLRHIEGLDIRLISPGMLNSNERQEYEKLLENFVPDHPFIIDHDWASVVFSDHVRAFISVSDTTSLHGASRAELLSASGPPGPFFAHFVFGLNASKGQSFAQESIVDDLIKSYTAGSGVRSFFTYIHSESDCSLQLAPSEEVAEYKIDRILNFAIQDALGVLELWSPVSNGVIVSENGVILNESKGELQLGPNLFLIAQTIEFSASRIEGHQANEERLGALLVANETPNSSAIERVIAYPTTKALRVSWPDVWHPWRSFAAKLMKPNGSLQTRKVWQATVAVRRLLTSFEPSVAGEPAIYWEKLERQIVGRSSANAAILKGLMQDKLIYKDGSLYRLQLSRLGELGINYSAMRGPDFAETLAPIVASLLENEELRESI